MAWLQAAEEAPPCRFAVTLSGQEVWVGPMVILNIGPTHYMYFRYAKFPSDFGRW